MSANKTAVPVCAAAVIGVALWLSSSFLTGRREPWDAGAYWAIAYPLAILACAWLGYAYPDRPWRWGLVLFESQFVGMCIRNGELGNLWPFGMLMFAVVALPAMAAAEITSRVSGRRQTQ